MDGIAKTRTKDQEVANEAWVFWVIRDGKVEKFGSRVTEQGEGQTIHDWITLSVSPQEPMGLDTSHLEMESSRGSLVISLVQVMNTLTMGPLFSVFPTGWSYGLNLRVNWSWQHSGTHD